MATPAPAAGRSGGAVLLGDWRERHQSTLTDAGHNVRVFLLTAWPCWASSGSS